VRKKLDHAASSESRANNTGENPSNLLGIKINVKNFAETITKSANLLDAVADEFSELKSNRFH